MDAIKPCSVCNGPAHKEISKHFVNPSVYIIRCTNTACPIRPVVAKTSEEKAIEAWNAGCDTF